MITLAEIRQRIEAYLPEIIAAQIAYRKTHKHYFQLLPTHTEIPAEGIQVAPDNLLAHPTDQNVTGNDIKAIEDWPDMFCSLRCDDQGKSAQCPSGAFVLYGTTIQGGEQLEISFKYSRIPEVVEIMKDDEDNDIEVVTQEEDAEQVEFIDWHVV